MTIFSHYPSLPILYEIFSSYFCNKNDDIPDIKSTVLSLGYSVCGSSFETQSVVLIVNFLNVAAILILWFRTPMLIT